MAQAIMAEAARLEQSVELVRNGSRGLLWLEPLVEIQTPQGRVAYGPVTTGEVSALFAAGWLGGQTAHPLCQGFTEDIPYLRRQERLTFARVGITDPLSILDYAAHGGLAGLERALTMTAAQIVEAVTASGLRGRGGAAFPTGVKWNTVLNASSPTKYIVCNADEGDSGTFADRLLMEGDPYALIEGMTIAGLAVGAEYGYIYVRSEYPHAIATLRTAIQRAREVGWLGDDIHGSGRRFDLDVRQGAGAYICGEETSLLESLEGKRGVVRAKPPLPAIRGLFGQPTVINNVISLATVPTILARGAAYYRDYGVGRSHGTLPFQLAGNIRHGGLVEKAFGLSLRELLYDFGGGSASGRPLRAAQVGALWALTCRKTNGMCHWATRPMPPSRPWWATAAWSPSTTAWIWHAWRATPWNSAPPSHAANVRLAASARRVASRRWTASSRAARHARRKSISCATSATPCSVAHCARWAAWPHTPCCRP
ncbi:respiratory-chain NADH dehydrogenase 51 Kd subunit [Bordetella holmesii 35009]|nr:respiratory-chain NADH dehydrogenase 51 Kd subunit [Bordetella holmesii 35009]